MNRRLLYTLLFLLCAVTGYAQTPLWAFHVGSTGNDDGYACKVAPNGNVYLAGKFTGTMDLDPGPGVYNVTSNGATDVYVACYTSAGAFLWGFGIGGTNYDGTYNITVDAFSNVFVSGFFQGGGMDFDPGPGIAIIPFSGGTGLTYEGDGFLAKYSSTGAFQWAKDFGGSTVYDYSWGVATDEVGNVYVSGAFCNTMAVPGGPTFSSAAAGPGYLIKYSPAGTYIWGHNLGELGIAAVDCGASSLIARGGYLYVGGYFRGTSNFDPWGTPALRTAAGGVNQFDPFVAKYDTAGNFIFVRQIASTGGYEEGRTISLDADNNIYYTGFLSGNSVTFDSSSPATTTFATPGGGGNYDIFVVKYSSSGAYIWGKVMGSTGDDLGQGIEVIGSSLYVTGQFMNTVNFNPSGPVADLTSAGGEDVFITKYDLDGNYLCGFRVGAAGVDDIGYSLTHDTVGNLYVAGQFGGVATDFDPTIGVYTLTSMGGTDAFLVKYNYGDTTYTGHLIGDTTCPGQPAHLTLVITTGTAGPYDITISNGSSTFTVTGVVPGVPFAVTPAPTATTIYSVTSAVFAGPGLCNTPSVSITGTATILVHPLATVIPSVLVNCNAVNFTAPTGLASYYWTFGDGVTSTLDPVTHTYASSGTYSVSLTVTDINGCHSADTITVAPAAFLSINLGPDTSICPGASCILQSSPAYSGALYLWNTGAATPTITATAPGTYWLHVSEGSCAGSDTVVVSERPNPSVNLGPDTAVCQGQSVTLHSLGAYTVPAYLWSTGGTSPSISVNTTGNYILTVTQNGCTGSDTVSVTIKPLPTVALPGPLTLCTNASIKVGSPELSELLGISYLWSTGSTDSAISITAAGTYSLTVTENGCSKSASVTVTDIGPPNAVHLGPDTVLCDETTFTLNANNSGNNNIISWSDGSNGETLTVTKSGTYWVSVTNECGTSRDTIKVDFTACNIWFPNAFTPNGDGLNDIARVAGSLGFYKDFRLSIYNRWGQRVFYTEDIYEGWDGTFKGVKQDVNTFFYMIFYTLNGKEHMLKGDLELIR